MVAAAEVVMNLGQLMPRGQVVVGGIVAQCFFVERDGFAPAVLVLELLTASHDAVDLAVVGRGRGHDPALAALLRFRSPALRSTAVVANAQTQVAVQNVRKQHASTLVA